MRGNPNTTRYFLYARKSSESEDRQVQSIDDQLSRLRELATLEGLTVGREFIEARSAKAPDQRPVFAELLKRVEHGEANGILCWQINRLSRNPIDSGRLSWLLQSGVLQSIRTIERDFRPEDNVLLLSVETGMANQYILDLRRNVMRGMDSKLQRGEACARAPVGYINDEVLRVAVRDPARFSAVQKLWRMFLSGAYSVGDLLKRAQEWELTVPRRRGRGGRVIGRSSLYNMLSNPFYAGVLRFAGREYCGSHESMISVDEFNEVQRLLGRTNRARSAKHHEAYNGIIRCGECGFAVSADVHIRRGKADVSLRRYVYYGCTQKRRDYDCSQRRPMKEVDLVEALVTELRQFSILPVFRDEALAWARQYAVSKQAEVSKRVVLAQKVVTELKTQLVVLTRMCYSGKILESEFVVERERLQARLAKDEATLLHSGESLRTPADRFEQLLSGTTALVDRFLLADGPTRRLLMARVGLNCTLRDGIITIEPRKYLTPILDEYGVLEWAYGRSEKAEVGSGKERTGGFAVKWLRFSVQRDGFG